MNLRRIPFSMLRLMEPGASESDARVHQDGESATYYIVKSQETAIPLRVCGARELRLLAKQLAWFADRLEDHALEDVT